MTGAGGVLIGGGTGLIGRSVSNTLTNKGYKITVVSRMPGPKTISWSNLQSYGIPKDTKAVVNLAGQNVMDMSRRWTAGFKQNVYNSRVNTTKLLAELIERAQPKPSAFVTISGVGAYKPDPEVEYTEESTCEPFDYFSKLCFQWEKAAHLNADAEKECRRVTIRSGVVLTKEGGMIKQLYLPFSLGLGGPVGDGRQFMPWIHIDDLTNLFVYAIENPKVEGILNGVAPTPCTNKEFSKAFGKALNRPALIPTAKCVFNLLLNKERAVMITEGQKVIPMRTLATGFRYQYPDIESACRAIVKS